MGAGRKTQTFTLAPPTPDLAPYSVPARKLNNNHLGGVIFGCKNSTMIECLSKQLFGWYPEFSASFAPNFFFTCFRFLIMFLYDLHYLNNGLVVFGIGISISNSSLDSVLVIPKI